MAAETAEEDYNYSSTDTESGWGPLQMSTLFLDRLGVGASISLKHTDGMARAAAHMTGEPTSTSTAILTRCE